MKRHFTVHHTILPAVGRASEAIPFDVPAGTWTLPGMSALSPNLTWLWTHIPQLHIKHAQATVAISTSISTGSKARFRIMHGQTNVWLPFGAELVQNPQVANAQNLNVLVTDEMNALSDNAGESWSNIGVEVQGTGLLFMARMAILYEVDDYTAEIADLTARITALESA